jgi:cytochrome c oxidase assembly factor CtaG
VPRFVARALPWLTLLAVIMLLAALLPPLGSYARHYAYAQALQFVIFAVAAPALLVPGLTSWRARSGRRAPIRADTDRRGFGAAAVRLLPFLALVIIWRLPAVLDALARHPALTVAEMVTLVCAGAAVWSELLAAAPQREPLPRPLRAAMAATAMWTIWIVAYITAMSGTGTIGGQTTAATPLSTVTDQEIAVGVMWAVPAIGFVPVVYAVLIKWLGERDDPDAELRAATVSSFTHSNLSRQPRPPRGWRSPLG